MRRESARQAVKSGQRSIVQSCRAASVVQIIENLYPYFD